MALRDILVQFGVQVDQSQIISAQKNVNELMGAFRMLQRVAGFALGSLGINALMDSADTYTLIENRLRATTKSAEDFAAAQRAVFEIARETATPVQDVTEQFQRYTMATEALGVSQDKVLTFTENLNKATQLGGATAQETRGALIQLAQGLGTDFKAAGQEIRSIQKGAPLLAAIIAKAAGGSAGELTLLAKAGKLSTEMVFNAVVEAGEVIDAQFAKRKLTFEQIGTMLGVEWIALMKDLEPAFGKVKLVLVDIVKWIREWVKDGSVMNTVIAGTILAVTLLASAFGGLALSAALASAPILGLFLILEDIIGFLRGDDSLLGRFLESAFGVDVSTKFRAMVQVWGDILTGVLTGSFDKAINHAANRLREAFGVKPLQGPQPLTPEQEMQRASEEDKSSEGVMRWIGDNLFGGEEYRKNVIQGRLESGWTAEQAGAPAGTTASSKLAPWDPSAAIPDAGWGPMPSKPPAGLQGVIGAPQITNHVTVQGDASPAVARDIAVRTGAATAASLGRDRAAVGAPFGVAP